MSFAVQAELLYTGWGCASTWSPSTEACRCNCWAFCLHCHDTSSCNLYLLVLLFNLFMLFSLVQQYFIIYNLNSNSNQLDFSQLSKIQVLFGRGFWYLTKDIFSIKLSQQLSMFLWISQMMWVLVQNEKHKVFSSKDKSLNIILKLTVTMCFDKSFVE